MNSWFSLSSPSLRQRLFILSVLVLFDFSASLGGGPGGDDELNKYDTCRKDFNCGNITGVSYPFWGDDRPMGCGHHDLQLHCHDGIASIEIKGVTYRVLNLNKDAQSLRIARQDYLEGICSPLLDNTTLDSKLFDFSRDDYQYITFVYGCPFPFPPFSTTHPISCSIAEIPLTHGYMVAGLKPLGPGDCNVSVSVPVLDILQILEGMAAWQNLVQLVEGVIGEGFEVRWKVDDGRDCIECLESKGVCGYDLGLNQTTCYCKDQIHPSKKCTSSTASPTGDADGPSPTESPPPSTYLDQFPSLS